MTPGLRRGVRSLWHCCFVVLAIGILSATATGQDIHAQDLRGPRPFALSCTVQGPEQWPANGEVHVLFNRLDAANYYDLRLTQASVELAKVTQGARRVVAGPANITVAAAHRVAVRRTLWRITVVCDQRIVLRAYDTDFAGGQVGWTANAAQLSVAEFSVTHFGELYVSDSFERVEGKTGDWEIHGQFGNIGLNSLNPTPNRAANPFSFGAQGYDRSLAILGSWHWDGYRLSAAAKGGGAGALGLAFYVQDSQNYLLFRWVRGPENDPTGRERQLIRVQAGKWALLDSRPGGYSDDRWHHLEVRACDGHVSAFIDEERVFDRQLDDFGMGRVGLYSAGGLGPAYFDDVSIISFDRFDEDFGDVGGNGWQGVSGQWSRANGLLRGKAAQSPAVALCGESAWTGVECSAKISLLPGGSAGLVARYQGGSYYLFQIDAPSGGAARTFKARLVRVIAGQPQTLVEKTGQAQQVPLEARFVADGPYLAGLVEGRAVVECADGSLAGGRVGLASCSPAEATFDSFQAMVPGKPAPGSAIVESFTREDSMATWASSAGRWRTVTNGNQRVRWYKGTFYRDMAIDAALPAITEAGGQLMLCIAADGNSVTSGYSLLLKADNPAQAAAILRRGDTVITTATVSGLNEGEHLVSLESRGKAVWAAVDEKPIISCYDPAPLHGREVGISYEGVRLSLDGVKVRGSNVLEYTFSQAPVDWYPRRGIWEVTDRWACTPGWAWFAGHGDNAPLLWSKRVFQGDITLEWYAAPKHIADRAYIDPGDLNCAICCDGSRLDSGYNFVFAGYNNTKTAILRGNQVVASAPESRLLEKDNFHRAWFHLRVEKRGSKLLFAIDGKPVLEWDDPQPLPGGRIAFWGYGKNGLLNALTRISYEAGGQIVPLPPARDSATDIPFSIYR